MLTVTPDWDQAYALFTKGEAPMVLSYTTSPAYHMLEEKTDRYQAAKFSDGQYIEIEVAGMTRKGAQNPLAKQFLSFMTGPRLPERHPRDQLDVSGRQDEPAARPGLRQDDPPGARR